MLLELVHEAFHQSTLAVKPGVILALLPAVPARRDNRNRPLLDDMGQQVIAIIGSIGNHILSHLLPQQVFALRAIMPFAASQAEVH